VLSTTERIQRYVTKIDARLRKDELSPNTMRVVTRGRLDVVLRECGVGRRGPKNLRAIREAFWAKRIFPHPDLCDPGLPLDEWIYMSKTPSGGPEEKRLRFPVHAGLERFLAENFPFLFPGLALVKTEFELASGNKADMLAKDQTTGEWVVIELKPAIPDRGVVSQIVDYMQEVRSAPPSKRAGRGVRGMVITGEADPVLQEHVQVLAAQEGFKLDWLVYRIEMTLAPPVVTSAPAQLAAPTRSGA